MKKSFRPTKAASKRRRDLLNVEISRIRNLLPFTEIQRQRLSQLQVMSLCNAYVSLHNFLGQFGIVNDCSQEILRSLDMTQVIPGFFLILTSNGQVLYASDNVLDCLGFTSVELWTQGDTIYDFIEPDDHSKLRMILESMTSLNSSLANDQMMTSCRMIVAQNFRGLSGCSHHRSVDILGRVLQRSSASSRCSVMPDAVFAAAVIPQSRPYSDSFSMPSFLSSHRLDMRYIQIDCNGCVLLGCMLNEIESKSWYETLHPDDIPIAKRKHLDVIHCRGQDSSHGFCVRMQTNYGHLVWLKVILLLNKNADRSEIICENWIISEEAAMKMNKMERNVTSSVTHDAAAGQFIQKPFNETFYAGELENGLCRRQPVVVDATGQHSSNCYRETQSTVETKLQSSHPLLKKILNRPALRDGPYATTSNPSQHHPVASSFLDSLLTPQNSPSDLALQDFHSNEKLIQTTELPTSDYLPLDLKHQDSCCSVSHDVWKQQSSLTNRRSFSPMSEDPGMESTVFDSHSSSSSSSSSSCFMDDVDSMPVDMIIAALRAMQSDPEYSKEMENLDLSIFSESFPELGFKKQISSKSHPDSCGSMNSLLNSLLMPYLNSSLTKLTETQVENLNRRLIELKKIHETMVFEAVVDTLHSNNNNSDVNCRNDDDDVVVDMTSCLRNSEDFDLNKEYKSTFSEGFEYLSNALAFENCQDSTAIQQPAISDAPTWRTLDCLDIMAAMS